MNKLISFLMSHGPKPVVDFIIEMEENAWEAHTCGEKTTHWEDFVVVLDNHTWHIKQLFRIHYWLYKPVVKMIAKLIIWCGNMRCAGHGKANYMQARVMNDVIDQLGGYIFVEMAYRDTVSPETIEARGWKTIES